MNRHLLFAFAVLLFSLSATAQTNVSGNITQNTTWTKAGSPYVLTGNVGVPSAYTLTIEPGVTVQRSDNYQVLINGAIQAAGTQTDSIFFFTSQGVPQGSRYFIEFQKSNLNRSQFRFISFQNDNGFQDNLRLGNETASTQTNPQNSGTLLISRSNLTGSYIGTQGYNTTASLAIDSSYMSAALIAQIYSNAEPINISNSQIYNSDFVNGIYGISFTNCLISQTDLPQTGGYTFLNSTIENSRLGGNGSITDYGRFTATNSFFTNTSLYSIHNSSYLTGCTFTFTDLVYNLDGSQSQYLLTTDGISMTNCKLINNSPGNISGLSLDGNGYNNFTTADTIVRNQFINVYDAVTIHYFPSIILDSNDFYTVGRYHIINLTTKDFSALNDYFQLKQGQTIDDVIYDQNDDLSYGLVTYVPYATSPNTGVLPVALTRFGGSRQGSTIQLNWQTGSEVNVAMFVVQRKSGSSYINLGTVAASGANGGSAYSFTDVSPVTGTSQYRLQVIDNNGRYTYSQAIPVTYTAFVKALHVYPNPASSYLIVDHAAAGNHAQLHLIGTGGSVVKTIPVARGSIQTRLAVSGLAKGIYQVVIKDGSQTESVQVVIQ